MASIDPEQGKFDLNQLSRLIAEERTERGLTWAEISREVGVAASTIGRFATASDAEADGVLALIRWLKVSPEHFVVNSKVSGLPLAAAGYGFIRVDMARLAQTPGWPGRARVGGRTTIQKLVDAAQASGEPVASLTRWSPM